MKRKLLYLSLIGLLTSGIPVQSQSIIGTDEMVLLKSRWDLALGTFQFQITDSRVNPQVNMSIIADIEMNRDENKIVYLDYAENIKIMILPKSTINDPFEKLNLFKYINKN